MTFTDPFTLHIIHAYMGFIAGFFGSMLGLGGGWLIVPVLQVHGVNPLAAVGTSLAAMVFTSSIGVTRYFLKKILVMRLGFFIALPALLGVFFGKALLSKLHAQGLSGHILSLGFMVLLIGLSIHMLASALRPTKKLDNAKLRIWRPLGPAFVARAGERDVEIGYLNASLVGIVAGFLSGLLGIGGGIILTPALVTLFGVPVVQAASTSLVSVLFSSVLGSTLYIMDGHVDLNLVVTLALGTTVGSFVGSGVAPKISDGFLKSVFGTLTLMTAGALLLRHYNEPDASVALLIIGSSCIFALTLANRVLQNTKTIP